MPQPTAPSRAPGQVITEWKEKEIKRTKISRNKENKKLLSVKDQVIEGDSEDTQKHFYT